MLKIIIEDIMTEHVVKLPEDATVMFAAHILLRFRINGVLVTDKENKEKVIGVVTTTDLLERLDEALSNSSHRISELEKLAKVPISEIATQEVIRIQKDTKLEKVIALMHRRKIYTLPVYDGEKLVGVIGRHDILNVAFAAGE